MFFKYTVHCSDEYTLLSRNTLTTVFHTHQLNPFNLQTSLDCAGHRHYCVCFSSEWSHVKLTLINLVLWEHKLPPPRFLCNVFFQSKSDQLPAMSTPNYTGYKANKSIKKNLYSEIHVKISNAKRQRCWFIVFIDKVYRNKSSI